ncbi:hypothetical protein AGR7A_pTi0119 [Agrobacterium deltaense NCPPB 1641]|uniref:Uncharacterized protein n=1 Tax=Agrobacterium deltaense NCPPB 1641 TaxID=1183425 RepID=A0A1S7UCA0_9HYPH|nr:hypothetical protein AGR7A_pTi0119 [Agrobacterium deltaense NCPPB 1641]
MRNIDGRGGREMRRPTRWEIVRIAELGINMLVQLCVQVEQLLTWARR